MKKDISVRDLVYWAFQAILIGVCGLAVNYLSEMSRSVQELNVKMAVVIEKIGNHEKRLEKLEIRGNN